MNKNEPNLKILVCFILLPTLRSLQRSDMPNHLRKGRGGGLKGYLPGLGGGGVNFPA